MENLHNTIQMNRIDVEMLKIPSPHVWSHRMLFLVTRNHRNMRIEDGILKIWISRKNFSPKFALGRVKLCVSNRIKSIKRGKKYRNPAARRMRVYLKKKKTTDHNQSFSLSSLPSRFFPLFLLSHRFFHPEPESSKISRK